MAKELFTAFLREIRPSDHKVLLEKFEQYYDWLLEENEKLNLISRKTDPETIWTLHFLDSLLSVRFVSLSGKHVLDFGTGGGFPGIPLAILFGDAQITLLDSRKKKIQSVRAAAELLRLDNCRFLSSRIEELPSSYNGVFDTVISRSVRMTPLYKKVIMRLLSSDGELVLYKSRNLEDVELFSDAVIHDVSTSEIGERKIIVIKKEQQIQNR
ncbi:MAG: 16S rRNA (guanine(527)-N(7))-methyltransferase RsmG [Chitinispirillaceae bacterium]